MATLSRLAQRILTLPGVDDHALGQVFVQRLIPTNHLAAMPGQYGLQLAVEVGVQCLHVAQLIGFHISRHRGALLPLGWIDLITPYVQIRIGENGSNLGHQLIDEVVYLGFAGIEQRLMDPQRGSAR